MTDPTLVVKHRRAVLALMGLELRDRWGLKLEVHKVAEIAAFVVLILDQEVLAEDMSAAVDALAIQMMVHALPMPCSGYDTPPDDELLEEIITTVRENR